MTLSTGPSILIDMTNKSLKGFLKSRHFQERQKQRNVSDEEIIKALVEGTLTENDHGHTFSLGLLRVTVNLDNETLITVHPGDHAANTSKVLSKTHAKNIRSRIEALSGKEDEVNEFLKYVHENSVKKL